MAKSKQKADELLKKYTHETASAWDLLGRAGIDKAHSLAKDYVSFLDASKTERLAARRVAEILDQAGFTRLDKSSGSGKVYQVYRDKCVLAARIDGKSLDRMLMVGAHIDSPRLDLKGNPLYEESNLGLFKTHYYGGIKKYQWMARPLALQGVVLLANGDAVEVSIGDEPGEPVLCVSDLLPHLSQDQNRQRVPEAFPAEKLNLIVGHAPYPDCTGKDRIKLAVLALLNERYGMVEEDLISAELEAVPAGKAVDVGFDGELIGGYGHDDRCCAYTGLRALIDAKRSGRNIATLLFDKEEIGSEGNTGAQGRFWLEFLGELLRIKGGDDSERGLRRLLAASEVLSADVTAALDPGWPEVHDKRNAALIGNGVVLTKYTGSRGKSGASDASAEFLGKVRRILNTGKVPWQAAGMGRVDLGGGGTIAKFVALHGPEVLDCGPALLSMHSPFELVSKADLYATYQAYRTFFERG
ncbi:MAG: aminopeptidase [Candidatus Alcyoniella australis]|nr:aminopeptidase [Candidatus Alcyoniella australis]